LFSVTVEALQRLQRCNGCCKSEKVEKSEKSENNFSNFSSRFSYFKGLYKCTDILPGVWIKAIVANSATRREAPCTLPWVDLDDPGLSDISTTRFAR
jgi:hypothetical protein